MAQILVRGLDEKTVNDLRRQAKAAGRTLQSEVKRILESSVTFSMEDAYAVSEMLRSQLSPGTKTNSTKLLRAHRNG